MSMSIHVKGYIAADTDWDKKKQAYLACQEAGIDVPEELDDFFDYGSLIDAPGKEIVITEDTLSKIRKFVDIDPGINTDCEIMVMFSDANLQKLKRKINRYKGVEKLSNAIQVILHDDTRLLIRNSRAGN